MSKEKPNYRDRVYEIVQRIPCGKIASYGQISRMIPHCTARMVGYALASLSENMDVPCRETSSILKAE